MKESRYNIWINERDKTYLYNSLSGGLLEVPRGQYEKLQDFLSGSGECSPSLLVHMGEGLMLVPDDADEVSLLAQRYDMGRKDTSRFGLTIVTSLGCNFDCPYCFEEKYPSIIDDEVRDIIFDVFDDQIRKQIRSFHVTWYGGEPLVGKRPLLELSDSFIERCRTADVIYESSIVTNGYLLDESTCLELRDRRIGSAQVSLDGPPDIHDKMRPLANGKGTFWKIVENLQHAINYFDITIRVNLDRSNADRVEELFQILDNVGLSRRVSIYPGHLTVDTKNDLLMPSKHGSCGMNRIDFSAEELKFMTLARRYGFESPALPMQISAPCTAVRANELVIGSDGELYKCWESPGNKSESIGNIRDYHSLNSRLQKWLKYDPFNDPECKSCLALPVCMGGCAQQALNGHYENRCSTFRFTFRERVVDFINHTSAGTSAPIPPQNG